MLSRIYDNVLIYAPGEKDWDTTKIVLSNFGIKEVSHFRDRERAIRAIRVFPPKLVIIHDCNNEDDEIIFIQNITLTKLVSSSVPIIIISKKEKQPIFQQSLENSKMISYIEDPLTSQKLYRVLLGAQTLEKTGL